MMWNKSILQDLVLGEDMADLVSCLSWVADGSGEVDELIISVIKTRFLQKQHTLRIPGMDHPGAKFPA